MRPEEIKKQVHQELLLRHREYFEAKLAEHIMAHAQDITSLQTVSDKIINVLANNQDALIELIRNNEKITNDLREPFFGALYHQDQSVDAETVYNDILLILKKASNNPDTAMQIHCIFEYRIFPMLEKNVEKKATQQTLLSSLKPDTLFNEQNRSRHEKNEKLLLSNKMGFTRNPVFSKLSANTAQFHARAVDKFNQSNHAPFIAKAHHLKMPTVCGPSGHTASLLSGAKVYGELNDAETNEYALLCFAFLAAGGNHSYHEVMSIAALLGIKYHAGNYASALPSTLIASGFFQPLVKVFPEFVDAECETAHTAALSA